MQRALLFAFLVAGCTTGEMDSPEPDEALRAGEEAAAPPEGETAPPSFDIDSGDIDSGGGESDTAVIADAPAAETSPPPVDDKPPESGPEPPPFPGYSKGACPAIVGGPTEATSLNTGFASGSDTRQFRVIVPSTYDGKTAWPVVFGYHWLGASSSGLLRDGELETAAAQMKFIVVLPDKLTNAAGSKVYNFEWPFNDEGAAPRELTFFDDMLACVTAKYKIDRRRVYVFGVSAGALWTTYLSTTSRANYVAAIETLSGGLGSLYGWSMKWSSQSNKFAALVLWGGPTDVLGINFDTASTAYTSALKGSGRFTVKCIHDKGHVMPPIPVPSDGTTRFKPLWKFLLDHPYGVASPYAGGLPAGFPSWCTKA
jgi:poly(3-hydroxybutyrate) depolymerase